MHPFEVQKLKENDIKHELPPTATQCPVSLYCNSIDQAVCKECRNSVLGYFFFEVVRAREFTHRTAKTNINRDQQQEVVRVNANHVQFVRDDLGSSVLSSPHQTQPSLRDSTQLKLNLFFPLSWKNLDDYKIHPSLGYFTWCIGAGFSPNGQKNALQLLKGNHDQIWTSSLASSASSVLKCDHSLLLNNTHLKQTPGEKKTRTVLSKSRIPVLDSIHDGFTTQICTIGPRLLAQKNVGFSHQDQKFVSTTNRYTMGWLSLCFATNSLAKHNSRTLPQADHWCCCW